MLSEAAEFADGGPSSALPTAAAGALAGGKGGATGADSSRAVRGGALSASREAAIREAVSRYEKSLQQSGAPEPWLLVEQLGDELLDEILSSVAQGLFNAAGECVETIAADELKV